MKILVIDDNQANLDNAIKQLSAEHEVVICNNYLCAEKMLAQSSEQYDEGHYWKDGEPNFEVVLTDLFMPPCFKGCTEESKGVHGSIEQPYGLIFMLMALRRGVKYLGLNSNANHHSGPMAWAADLLTSGQNPDSFTPYIIGQTKVLSNGEGYLFWDNKNGYEKGTKNWAGMLNDLLR